MKLHSASGISFNPDVFDESFIEMLDKLPEDAVEDIDLDAGPKMPLMTAPATELSAADVAAIMESAWEELYASDEGADIRALPADQQAQIKARFLSPDPIPEAEAATVPVDAAPFSVQETADSLILMQGDTPLLGAPLGTSRKKRKKAALNTFIGAAAKAFADIITMAMAALGVYQALGTKTVTRAGAGIAVKCSGPISRHAGAIAKAGTAGSDLAMMKAMLGVAKASVGFTKLAGIVLTDMSGLEKAAAIATCVGGMTLAVASASGSFWVSMLAMVTAVAMFVIDTALAVDTYKKWQAI
ncbi:hypothetical protein [Ruegeria sp. HKCCSP351]|uniref:hypothetical protein n=1 Tax=Ruegeria sp. HKCCSP351 TaxID=2794832 RepID=UPI001AE64FEE|nr:hypothetical protein [Ruegeria sp. HKCCSP351]